VDADIVLAAPNPPIMAITAAESEARTIMTILDGRR
jgi:hypothetical protein